MSRVDLKSLSFVITTKISHSTTSFHLKQLKKKFLLRFSPLFFTTFLSLYILAIFSTIKWVKCLRQFSYFHDVKHLKRRKKIDSNFHNFYCHKISFLRWMNAKSSFFMFLNVMRLLYEFSGKHKMREIYEIHWKWKWYEGSFNFTLIQFFSFFNPC